MRVHLVRLWLCLLVVVSWAIPVVAQDTTSPPATQSKQVGSAHITLSANRANLGLADRFQLTLAIEAPTGTDVILPEATEQLGAFTVRGQTPTGPTSIDPQTQRWQQVYTLEANATGEQTIPPLTLSIREVNADPDAAPTQIQTEPYPITVISVLPEDADVMTPQDIAPPVALAAPGLSHWIWLAVAGLILLAGGLFWWWRRREQKVEPPPPPRPAHALALEALRRLQRDNLMEQCAIEPFYVQLSAILRQYIEWRFQLRAPEQTTEEFLALASGGLIATHRDLLSSFLHQCDLVKFARHQPGQSDMQNAFDSAKAFIEQTADDEVLIEVATS